ncbi:glycosyltransferase family 2 protein [Brevibacterium sp. Marseille-P9724]|uniref:glycosyltransferase family 2 protein n=1 Tax=Brevibacterium sp. Marseille-P9724 TaxID=2614125 RepID=UPI00125EF2A0|nr:glycosyltransferase family 2 protein [Brevibacterium sp. Marseille-P9724]
MSIDLSQLWELDERPGVSFIMPVLNEEKRIERAVQTVLDQEYLGPKEIVIGLGPSTDRTTEIAERMAREDARVTVVHNPAGDTPTSLNLAIAETRYPVIIRVDAHSELPRNYAALGVDTLRETGAANVGGLMRAVGDTPFQKAVARAYMSPIGLGGPAYHSGAQAGPSESAYLGIFRREVFELLGGFDPTLRRGQDWELNLRIRAAGGLVWFNPELTVTYWPRADIRSVAQQFYATGKWRAEIVRRHSTRNSLRYFAPPVLVGGLAAAAVGTALQAAGAARRLPTPVRWGIGAAQMGAATYAAAVSALAVSAPDADRREKAAFVAAVPTMHIAWGTGFIKGIVTGADHGDADRSRTDTGGTRAEEQDR